MPSVAQSNRLILKNKRIPHKKSQINGNCSENLRFIFCSLTPKCNRSRCYKASPMQSVHRSAGHGNRFRIGCIEAVSFRDNPKQIFAYNPNPLSNLLLCDNMTKNFAPYNQLVIDILTLLCYNRLNI